MEFEGFLANFDDLWDIFGQFDGFLGSDGIFRDFWCSGGICLIEMVGFLMKFGGFLANFDDLSDILDEFEGFLRDFWGSDGIF